MDGPEVDSINIPEYENPGIGHDNQRNESLTSNPVYSLAKPDSREDGILTVLHEAKMDGPEVDSINIPEYENPGIGHDNQRNASLTSNPVYSLAKPDSREEGITVLHEAKMDRPEKDITNIPEYEDPGKSHGNQRNAPLTSNPVYSLAKPLPDYELLSEASTVTSGETNAMEAGSIKTSGYEELGTLSGTPSQKGYEFVDAIQEGPHEYEMVSEIAKSKEKKRTPYEGLIKEYSFDVTVNQTPDVKELGLTSRYRLVLGNLCMILFPRMQLKIKEPIEPQPVYSWFYADIRRYSFSKQMREFAIYCGRSCPTPEKIICFRVKTDLVQLLQVVNEKTGGAFQAELANMKVKKRVCAVS